MSSEVAQDLSLQTKALIERFEVRANAFRGRDDLARLTIRDEPPTAESFARDYLGEGEHSATGIDGSMDFDERLQMMLFYSNATAYTCPLLVGERVEFDLDSAHRDSRLAASAAVPLWAEDLAIVTADETEVDFDLEHSLERIPNSFMTLGELYLGALAVERSKVVFLDRPLSGTYSTLARDARILVRQGGGKLPKWSQGRLSLADIYLALNVGSPIAEIPGRRRYLPSSLLRALISGPKTLPELSSSLGASQAQILRAVRAVRRTEERLGVLFLDASDERFSLAPGVEGYWERASAIALEYARAAFERRRHPLALNGEEYLTILDVNAVSLILLQLICERAHQKNGLVIGIAKDTTATDLGRSVVPFAVKEGAIELDSPAPRLKSDRAFLALLTAENSSIPTPWRTPGYDSAFSTIVSTGEGFRSARKVVSRERLFVRSFFQLRTLRSDPSVRSQVFLFDRPFDNRHDGTSVSSLTVDEQTGPATVEAYFEEDASSSLSNLALHILSLCDNPEVFEAFGHNQLLYLADKAVKSEVKMLRSSLRAVADLRVGSVSSRRRIFGLVSTYREQRAGAEQARGRSAR